MEDLFELPDMESGDRPLQPYEPILELIAASVLTNGEEDAGEQGAMVDLAIDILLAQPKTTLVDFILVLAESVAAQKPTAQQLADLIEDLEASNATFGPVSPRG